MDELEQYKRMDDLVVSGLVTTHRSYARIQEDGLEGYETFWQNRVNRRGGVLLYL